MRLEYFELLDRVEEIDFEAGTIRVSCTLPEHSPIFDGHFPKFPILPGVMMLEIMNHTAGFLLYRRFNKERFVFLGGVKRAKFRRMVKPGTALAGALARAWNSVWVKLGHSTVTDTPVPFNSSCTASVNDVTNAFVALYVALEGPG